MNNLDKFLRAKKMFNFWNWFWWTMVLSVIASYFYPTYVKGFSKWHIFIGYIISTYAHTLYKQMFWKVAHQAMDKGRFYSVTDISQLFKNYLSNIEIVREFDNAVAKRTAQKLQQNPKNPHYRLL